jgi:lipopolysaccharide/colanic/teichoic acid biosynthesis glycosyltransferase
MMSGEPLELQRLSSDRRNSSEVRQFPLRNVEFTNTDTCNSHPSATTKIFSPSSRRNPWEGRIEIGLGQDTSPSSESSIPFRGLLVKRLVDLFLSALALLFLWPLLLVIAVAVKLESPGPILFASLRAGEKGQKFVCYKFRTMIDKADELKSSLRRFNEREDPFFKMANDPRVTRLGHFLRKYSLDELPQFWNVLNGDMSLVGPRPHPLDDCAGYRPGDYRRLEVKPGITGLWQITARTNPSFETCMTLDLAYIKHWGLLFDFWILLRTVPVVLSGDGE